MRRVRQLLIVCGVAFAAAAATAQDSVDADAVETAEPAMAGRALNDAASARTTRSTAMDELDLGRTEITGNQELPKVLYIVPWQKSAPGNLLGRPVNSLLDEVLAPLDREEFIRQVDYYSDLNEPQDE